MEGRLLSRSFYTRFDVLPIAQELLGKIIVTHKDDFQTSGVITEVEAYQAPEDKASHAYNHRRTGRTETMYLDGGRAYVYLCYGIHRMLNVVTGGKDVAHAILIRSVEPLDGMKEMVRRRNLKNVGFNLTSGPGNVGKALRIAMNDDGVSLLTQQTIWIEDRGIHLPEESIGKMRRIGIDYAEEWAEKKWRFLIKENPWVSRPNG